MKILSVALIVAVLSVAVIMIMKPSLEHSNPERQNQETPQTTNINYEEMTFVALNTQNKSGEMGVATLKEVNGKVVVKLEVKGEPKGDTQDAHIHFGSCPKPGVAKFPLTPIENGISETTLDVSMAELRGFGPLAINAHKEDSPTKYVVCGDIKF